MELRCAGGPADRGTAKGDFIVGPGETAGDIPERAIDSIADAGARGADRLDVSAKRIDGGRRRVAAISEGRSDIALKAEHPR